MKEHMSDVHKALRACRGAFGIIMAFSLAINLLMLATPLYMMQVFDRVLGSRSGDTLVMLTLITVLAIAVLALLDAIRAQMLVRIGNWLDDRLGPTVFAGALRAALRSDPARASQGLRDLGTMRGFLTGPTVTPLLDAPWAPIFIIALFALHPMLGLIGLGGGVVLFGLALVNEIVTKHPLRRANLAASKTHQRAEAALRNAEVIRAMGMGEGVLRLWRRDSAGTNEAQRAAGTRGGVILALSKFSRLLVQTVILGAGAWLVIHQEASAGAMFASSFLLGRALAPVENAIGTWKSLVAARLAHRRLDELVSALPDEAKGMELPRPERMSPPCAAWDSSSPRAKCWASSARRRRASRRSPVSSPAPGRRPPARCGSTAPTSPCGMIPAARSMSATCRRTSSSSPARCATILPGWAMRRPRRSSRRPSSSACMRSSCGCRAATTARSARPACASQAASVSASGSRAPSSAGRAWSCSTSPTPASTMRVRKRCITRSRA